MIAGCGAQIVYVRDPTKSKTELAVENLRGDWLKPCPRVDDAVPENNTGNLLLDYIDLSATSAKCAETHNSLVDFLNPLVEEEKARRTTQEPAKAGTIGWPWKQGN